MVDNTPDIADSVSSVSVNDAAPQSVFNEYRPNCVDFGWVNSVFNGTEFFIRKSIYYVSILAIISLYFNAMMKIDIDVRPRIKNFYQQSLSMNDGWSEFMTNVTQIIIYTILARLTRQILLLIRKFKVFNKLYFKNMIRTLDNFVFKIADPDFIALSSIGLSAVQLKTSIANSTPFEIYQFNTGINGF